MAVEQSQPGAHIRARAVLVGERLDLRALETTDRLASNPLVLRVTAQGVAVLFRYGAVVLFDVTPVEEVVFIERLQPMVAGPYDKRETEALEIRIDTEAKEELENQVLLLNDADLSRLQIVADVLAKSVALAEYEARVGGTFDRIEPLAAAMQRRGTQRASERELIRHIGSTLLAQHRMVGRVEVGEKPEILWEQSKLERLYLRLEDEYELKERQLAIERKLEVIARTAETLHGLIQARRTLHVEWYIVILIVIEILLTLYELFIRGEV